MAKVKNPWGDGRDADVSDSLCCIRSCLNIGENKGSYTQGRGYTSYYSNPQLECMTRHLRGCPLPIPEPDPELARCCRAPNFPKPRGKSKPSKQKCRTCGQWSHKPALELCRDLPTLPHVSCRHEKSEPRPFLKFHGHRCPQCGAYFTKRPKPMEPGITCEEMLDIALDKT